MHSFCKFLTPVKLFSDFVEKKMIASEKSSFFNFIDVLTDVRRKKFDYETVTNLCT